MSTPTTSPHTVFAVIVTWNGERWIRQALDSLMRSAYPVQVIVVDNDSSDTTAACIQSDFPQVTLLKMATNLGFGRANNIGIVQALQRGAEYILLLNQDARLDPAALTALVQALETHPEYGLVSPLQMDYDGRAFDPVFLKDAVQVLPSLKEPLDQWLHRWEMGEPLPAIVEIDFIQASIWLMARQAVETTGGFDPIFFMYGEDNDYCNRMRFHGYKVGILPGALAYHWHSGKGHRRFSLSRRINGVYSSLLVTLKMPARPFRQNVGRALRRWWRKEWISLQEGDWAGCVAALGALGKICFNAVHIARHYHQGQIPGAYLEAGR